VYRSVGQRLRLAQLLPRYRRAVAAGRGALVRLVPAPSEDRRLSAEERELIVSGQEPYQQQEHAPWRTIARHRDVWAISAGYFCLLYILYTFVTWVPSYLVQDRHMTILRSGLATSIPWICAFAVAVLAGPTSDIALRRGVSVLNTRKIVLTTGMVAALAILGTAFSSSATVAIICLSISISGIIFADGAALAATPRTWPGSSTCPARRPASSTPSATSAASSARSSPARWPTPPARSSCRSWWPPDHVPALVAPRRLAQRDLLVRGRVG
jgi:Major Facilitator Superfamily